MRRLPALVLFAVVVCLALAACGGAAPADEAAAAADATTDRTQPVRPGRDAAPGDAPSPGPPPEPGAAAPSVAQPDASGSRPAWLGTRVLPLRADGFGEIQPTPPELDDRRLPPPPDALPPAGAAFASTIAHVPDEIVARATWSPKCPVGLDELRYVTVVFWGFDDRPHTGELLVHASVADGIAEVFHRLYDARFPIEEMRVVAPDELDAPPTGDGNNTTSFVCRSTVSSGKWSRHAYGLAVDINPFHNPYLRGEVVVPELASSYVDRARHRPGMIEPGDAVTGAFAAIGWRWGGTWSSAKDWMHFSDNGR